MNLRRLNLFKKDRGKCDAEKPVFIETKIVHGTTVSLDLSFGHEFWTKLSIFLRNQGIENCEGMALLLEYGAQELDNSKELSTAEKFAVSSRYSSLKFRMFECFEENRAIVVGLSVHLHENRELKEKLIQIKGKGAVTQDEWDDWGSKDVEEYQNKYLFSRRV